MADAGTWPIGEDLEERQTERRGDRLHDLLAEAIPPARVAARNAGERLAGLPAVKLPDKRGEQLSRVVNEGLVNFELGPFECGNVLRLRAGALGAGGDASDFVPPEHHRTIDERAEQAGFVPRALGLERAGAKCR